MYSKGIPMTSLVYTAKCNFLRDQFNLWFISQTLLRQNISNLNIGLLLHKAKNKRKIIIERISMNRKLFLLVITILWSHWSPCLCVHDKKKFSNCVYAHNCNHDEVISYKKVYNKLIYQSIIICLHFLDSYFLWLLNA